MNKAIIIDIDGTAALGIGDHRKPYEYDKAIKDEPNPMVWKLIHAFSKEYQLIFLSGRENVNFREKFSDRNEEKGIIYEYGMPHINQWIKVDDPFEGVDEDDWTYEKGDAKYVMEFENCYDLTRWWLTSHLIGASIRYTPLLFMRGYGNHQRDDIVKEELYTKNVKPYYDVELVIDDRQQVVDMWRKLGLTCWQVAPGNF